MQQTKEKQIAKILGWHRHKGHWEDRESYDMTDTLKELSSFLSSELENIFLEMEKVIKDFKLVTPEENEFEDLPRKMVFGSGQMNMQVRVLTKLKKLEEELFKVLAQ